MTQHVNPEQIEALFAFVQKKRVRHYDLQVELVDHLASSIEGLWKGNPDVSFEKALQKVYKRFGVTGFSRVIQEKEKALTKLAWRWAFEYLKGWLRIPHLLFLILIIASFANILLWLPSFGTVVLIVFTFLVVFLFVWYYVNEQRLKKSQKQRFMMLENSASVGMALSGISGMSGHLLETMLVLSEHSVTWIYLFTLYQVLFLLLLYALLIHNRKKAIEYLNKHFPQSIA